jgi:hypothetical protein
MRQQALIMRLAVAGLILASLLGCGDLPDLGLTQGPEQVAGQWFEAVGAFDTPSMYQLTHPERRADLEVALRKPLVTLGAAVGLREREYFNMSYTLVLDDGQAAQVHVAGKFANRLGMIESVDRTIKLRKLEGQWYIWSAEGWF